jgi:hypothetical protein
MKKVICFVSSRATVQNRGTALLLYQVTGNF